MPKEKRTNAMKMSIYFFRSLHSIIFFREPVMTKFIICLIDQMNCSVDHVIWFYIQMDKISCPNVNVPSLEADDHLLHMKLLRIPN